MRKTAAPITSVHSTMAMTIRPERRGWRGGEISRSGHGTDGVTREGVGPGRHRRRERPGTPGTARSPPCTVGRCATPIHRVRAGQRRAPRRRDGGGAAGTIHGRGGRAVRGRGGSGRRGLRALDALTPGFWVGWCSFELGHAAERRGGPRRVDRTGERARPRVRPLRHGGRRRPRGGIRVRGGGPGRACSTPSVARRTQPLRDGVRAPIAPSQWTSGLDRDEYADRVEPVLDLLARRRVLPGQPDASPHVRRRHRSDRAVRRAGAAHPAPHPRCCTSPARSRGQRWCRRHPSGTCGGGDRDVETRPIKGTAGDKHGAPRQQQGPRRERDDRRPRPQRPRPRLRAGISGTFPSSTRSSRTRACTTS